MTLQEQIEDLKEQLSSWITTRSSWETALETHTNYNNETGIDNAQEEIKACHENIAALRSQIDELRRQDAIEASL